ncbi:hypothetical protein CMV_015663 [Castanea mollissima]|uniref:Uncharacterized protein n=1 Tax=Castanea mollissima TaxID=60419 RepID=A0A8J4R4W4_9ROSI|nr:hypothetical protein CMV_015663 [Castanea mollissima]
MNPKTKHRNLKIFKSFESLKALHQYSPPFNCYTSSTTLSLSLSHSISFEGRRTRSLSGYRYGSTVGSYCDTTSFLVAYVKF